MVVTYSSRLSREDLRVQVGVVLLQVRHDPRDGGAVVLLSDLLTPHRERPPGMVWKPRCSPATNQASSHSGDPEAPPLVSVR